MRSLQHCSHHRGCSDEKNWHHQRSSIYGNALELQMLSSHRLAIVQCTSNYTEPARDNQICDTHITGSATSDQHHMTKAEARQLNTTLVSVVGVWYDGYMKHVRLNARHLPKADLALAAWGCQHTGGGPVSDKVAHILLAVGASVVVGQASMSDL